jgi:hypothetical protein
VCNNFHTFLDIFLPSADEGGTEITQITSPFITNEENLLGPIYGVSEDNLLGPTSCVCPIKFVKNLVP